MTSLLSYTLPLINYGWAISLSYEESQILTVTLYYINGIINPLTYFLTHPATRVYVSSKWMRKRDAITQSSVNRGEVELSGGSRPRLMDPLNSSQADVVCLSNINIARDQ